ncbi:MAG: hypothetical protein GY929_06140 [Actinomycetia bacterium]|nr:hypothetical protein [Actinomycetes bacterium]
MPKFWLMDQHDGKGPTALVEADGRLQVIDVLRFGPSVTELEDQQRIWDAVVGRVAPTLKPFVPASSVEEAGVAPDPKLRRGDEGSAGRAGRGSGGRSGTGPGRSGSGPQRTRSRGER